MSRIACAITSLSVNAGMGILHWMSFIVSGSISARVSGMKHLIHL